MAGSWEFPGGKVEPGESRIRALTRELNEELGIYIGLPRPLMRVRHSYPSGDVLIDMWVVTRYEGTPVGLDSQALRWCTQDDLAEVRDFLAADRPIVKALRLPAILTRATSLHYEIKSFAAWRAALKEPPRSTALRGVFCSSAAEGIALAESRSGCDVEFLVFRSRLSEEQLARVCERVCIPVFAYKIPLDTAFILGASGSNTIEQ